LSITDDLSLTNKRVRVGNWKLHAAKNKAASLGFQVRFVRKTFGPRHAQNRIYINGRRCQLMTGLRVNSTDNGDRATIDVRFPENTWAEFLIYVPELFAERELPFFIVPRRLLTETSHGAEELNQCVDGWHLLGRSGGKGTPYSGVGQRSGAESANRGPQIVDDSIESYAL
jgi:hypothetical protein